MANKSDDTTQLAELCAIIDAAAAAETMGERRVASISAMIDEFHAVVRDDDDDVKTVLRRRRSSSSSRKMKKRGRWWRRVDGTSRTQCSYRQIETISNGGFGVVVKAENRDTGETVAIKTLRRRGGADADAYATGVLLREACFMAACGGNPHLVGLHGVARNPQTKEYSLVMEYVGPSLSDAMDEHVKRHGRGNTESTVRRTMRQLLAGVEAMHGRGVIHRNIKLSNILVVDGDGDAVKICDFGLAVSTAEAAPPCRWGGTDWYMSPEMLLEVPDYDELVDMWSLGCVMAKLLSGKALFRGEGINEQLDKIFDVVGVPGKKTRKAFESKSKLLAQKVRQWQWRARQSSPEQRRAGVDNRLRELFPETMLSQDGFEVLKGLLTFNPAKRMTASAALRHRWFAGADDSKSGGAAALFRKATLLMFLLVGVLIIAWALVRLSIGVTAGN
uniref:[RNA-polymerase]-subunit kinase n=1 Tax=Leersia perrieri TaxID=77586 RepID=A0A0D9XE96_9ORYZ